MNTKIQDLQAKISKCTVNDGDLKFKLQYELDGLLIEQAKNEFKEYKDASTRLTRTGVAITIIQGGKK